MNADKPLLQYKSQQFISYSLPSNRKEIQTGVWRACHSRIKEKNKADRRDLLSQRQ